MTNVACKQHLTKSIVCVNTVEQIDHLRPNCLLRHDNINDETDITNHRDGPSTSHTSGPQRTQKEQLIAVMKRKNGDKTCNLYAHNLMQTSRKSSLVAWRHNHRNDTATLPISTMQ